MRLMTKHVDTVMADWARTLYGLTVCLRPVCSYWVLTFKPIQSGWFFYLIWKQHMLLFI